MARMQSSLFDDTASFPDGTCTLDSALLMTDINACWTAGPRASDESLSARPCAPMPA
jgi:hypothetical protein